MNNKRLQAKIVALEQWLTIFGRYCAIKSAVPGQKTLLWIKHGQIMCSMPYDEELPILSAIKLMRQRLKVSKQFGKKSAGFYEKFN